MTVEATWMPQSRYVHRYRRIRRLQLVWDAERNDEWESDTASPPTGDAAKHGYSAIEQLVADGYISSSIAARGKSLIKFLFKANTVDTAVSPDDDALSLYWVAEEMALTIIVYQSSYWWSVRNIAGTSFSGSGNELPFSDLDYSLKHFSKEVDRRNPEWRKVIR